MITSKELAKMAGVSQSTVSRALNDSPLVSEETKTKIIELAQKHEFMFNYAAQSLKAKKTGFVGYVFSENFQSFSQNVSQGCLFHTISKKLKKFNLDIFPIFDDNEDIIKHIINRKVDALIVNRVLVDDKIVKALEKHNIPYVLIYDVDEFAPYPYVVASNHYKSGYMAGKAFVDRGYDKFLEFQGSLGRIDVARKHRGFTDALKTAGIELDGKYVLNGDYSVEGGNKVAKENIELFRNVNACFVHNDTMAIGVMEALKEEGFRIPEDIAIIGHDNVPMSNWFSPKLTTISVNYERISAVTTELLFDLINGNSQDEFRKVIVNSELIIRETLK